MRRSLKRALAVMALLGLCSAAVLGWAVALHLASDHHGGGRSDHAPAFGPELVLHGHAHGEGTPAHGHSFVGSVAVSIPGKLLLLIGARIGDAPAVVLNETSGRRLLSQGGPTHDPPRRFEATTFILRI